MEGEREYLLATCALYMDWIRVGNDSLVRLIPAHVCNMISILTQVGIKAGVEKLKIIICYFENIIAVENNIR